MTRFLKSITDWFHESLGLSPAIQEKLFWSLGAWLLFIVIRFIISGAVHRRVGDVTKQYTLTKTIHYILGFAFVLVVLFVWFGNVTGLVAYLGILSAGLAIALQDPVTNLAGWVFLAIRKPFTVGDRVQIGEHRGDVIDMRLFQFSLMEVGNWVDAEQSTGRIIHIPNGWVFKNSTANYTGGFNFIWNEIPITLTFESNWEKAKEILNVIIEKHTALKDKEAMAQVRQAARKYMISFTFLTPIVWTTVADHGVTLTLRYICEPRKRRSTEMKIWEDILRSFALHSDIDFAYPTTRFYNNSREGKVDARADSEN
ncbi:mechanosensitive ion channel [bacterium]|nr:mechanosensitive ion channel [bacterium]